jgi:hypothetical protein
MRSPPPCRARRGAGSGRGENSGIQAIVYKPQGTGKAKGGEDAIRYVGGPIPGAKGSRAVSEPGGHEQGAGEGISFPPRFSCTVYG